MENKLDHVDQLILQLLYNQDNDPERKGKPRYSLKELLGATASVRSIGTIYNRVSRLEELGYVNQPGRKVPRSRTITDEGKFALWESLRGTNARARNPASFSRQGIEFQASE